VLGLGLGCEVSLTSHCQRVQSTATALPLDDDDDDDPLSVCMCVCVCVSVCVSVYRWEWNVTMTYVHRHHHRHVTSSVLLLLLLLVVRDVVVIVIMTPSWRHGECTCTSDVYDVIDRCVEVTWHDGRLCCCCCWPRHHCHHRHLRCRHTASTQVRHAHTPVNHSLSANRLRQRNNVTLVMCAWRLSMQADRKHQVDLLSSDVIASSSPWQRDCW